MIAQDFLHQLLDKVDVVDVIDRYVPLKKGGQNYMACCPFHQEKTPSFTVSPHKQFFYCFGCGAHGTAISFIMQYQGLSFVEAVEQLAQSVSMPVPHTTSSGRSPQTPYLSLEKLLMQVTEFYQSCLTRSAKSLDYLKKRGVSDEMIQKFGIGYAPDDAQLLLKQYPTSHLLLDQAGLTSTPEGQNSHYCRFRDRIMFPIRNQKGVVIGFGGRTMDTKKEPKYLNSPETVLFKKGQELYGFFEVRQALHQARRVVVVEGYMDVMALVQHGIGDTVATLGTATTPEQMRKLLQYADDIYFCFDGDEAGHKAAFRALENSLPVMRDGKSVSFLFLPSEHDPDSFIRAYSAAVFTDKLTKESMPLSTYLIHQLVDGIHIGSPEGRAKLVHHALPWLVQLKQAPLLSYMIRNRLAELTHMTVTDFEALCGQHHTKQSRPYHDQVPQTTQRLQVTPLIHRQFAMLLMNPSWVEDVALPEMIEDVGQLKDDVGCFVGLVDKIQQYDSIPSSAALMEGLRGTRCEAMLKRVLTIYRETSELMDTSQEARQAFRDGNQRLLTDYLRQAQLQSHMDQLANKPYQASTDADKRRLVGLLKKP